MKQKYNLMAFVIFSLAAIASAYAASVSEKI